MIWTIQCAFTIGKSCLSNLIALWDETVGFADDGRHGEWYLLLLWQIPCFVIVIICVVLCLRWLGYLMGWKNSKDSSYWNGRDLEHLPCEEGSWEQTDSGGPFSSLPLPATRLPRRCLVVCSLWCVAGRWKLKYKRFRFDRKKIFVIEGVKQWIKLLVFQIPNCK